MKLIQAKGNTWYLEDNMQGSVKETVFRICGNLSLLSSRVHRSTYYERNIRTYLEYMVDTQMIEAFSERGVTCLRPFE